MKASRCQFLKPTPTEATPAEDLKSGTNVAVASCFETEKIRNKITTTKSLILAQDER